nr:hypothetical protein [Mycolicibacterium malmesburyense]CRL67678.1 hypothetical protein CPGR_00542 [Mycolicibacterium malmesburyense]
MHSTGKLFATTMIAAAGAVSAALALSATASAQPAAPAPAPSVPGLPLIQQLASNPAAATQLMQGVTSLLNTAQAPAAPAATPPSATASVTLPQPPSALPGMPQAPAAPAAAPSTAPANPADLLSNLPTGLASLLPEGTPLTGLLPAATQAATPSAAAPAAAAPAAAAPAAAAPAAAPALPSAGMAPLLMPLSALP